MDILKCTLAGLAAGFVAAVTWVAAKLTLLVALATANSQGSGGLGAMAFGLGSVAIPTMLGFAAGFLFMRHRLRRRGAPR
jgi:hypothetical protein